MKPFLFRRFSYYLLALTAFLISFNTFGQSLSPNKYNYVEVTFMQASELKIFVSFGNEFTTVPDEKRQEIALKIKEFNSGAAILNYMSDIGWEYTDKQIVQTSVLIGSKYLNITYVYYTFRKLRTE